MNDDDRLTFVRDAINEVDDAMRGATAKYYCRSDYCLCPADTDFSKWDEAQLRTNQRTKLATYTNSTDGVEYVTL